MADFDADRKLVAILCADVAGYSRMIGEDEEGTLAALAAHMTELVEPTIARHHGRIVKTTGDGFLAEFASPVAAALAALETQEGLRSRNADVPDSKRQWLRVGLTLGDVMVRDGDIFGDAVNVAARLQSLAEPGSVYASAAVIDQLRGHIVFAWNDLGEKALRNIARPVRVYRLAAGATATPSVWATLRRRVRPRLVIGIIAISALLAVGGYGWWQRFEPPIASTSVPSEGRPMLQAKPSVAVLPLVNQSGDPANDYFSDGITGEIIDALGRFAALTVMDYNATRPYKGKAMPPADIGRELGVRYLVDGSVRRAADRVRVSVRLTDAGQGVLLWSQQFDEQLSDIFALEDKIARSVAGTLAAKVTSIETKIALAKPTENLDAYDLVLRGRAKLLQATRSANHDARQLFEQALRLDPDYAAAHAGLGLAYLDMASFGWTEFPEEMLARAEQHAREALSRDPDNIEAHVILSEVHSTQLQNDRALAEIERALEINPSDAASHSQRGSILLWTGGRIDEAIAELETAFTLDPNSADAFALGLAYYTARRHDDCVRFLERESLRHPDRVYLPMLLAATYAQLGRAADAKRVAEAARRRLPVIDPKTFGSRFRNPADQDYLIDGLRKAGLI